MRAYQCVAQIAGPPESQDGYVSIKPTQRQSFGIVSETDKSTDTNSCGRNRQPATSAISYAASDV